MKKKKSVASFPLAQLGVRVGGGWKDKLFSVFDYSRKLSVCFRKHTAYWIKMYLGE